MESPACCHSHCQDVYSNGSAEKIHIVKDVCSNVLLKMHKKLLESFGALEGAWPPRRGQDWLNPCKRGDSGGSGKGKGGENEVWRRGET